MSKQRKHIKIEAAEDLPIAASAAPDSPENWKTQYENILFMRRERNAPVDTMGCEKVQNSSDDPKVRQKGHNVYGSSCHMDGVYLISKFLISE